MTSTTTTSEAGQSLREARERVGLTRVQLAAIVGCSLGQLANIEQGAVPKQSRVLEAAFEAITAHANGNEQGEGGSAVMRGVEVDELFPDAPP